jgi:hypothetical protein
MKDLMKNIAKIRQQLITEYERKSVELDKLEQEEREALKAADYKKCESIFVKRLEVDNLTELGMAINDLGNALGHLGENVETYWGK